MFEMPEEEDETTLSLEVPETTQESHAGTPEVLVESYRNDCSELMQSMIETGWSFNVQAWDTTSIEKCPPLIITSETKNINSLVEVMSKRTFSVLEITDNRHWPTWRQQARQASVNDEG